MAYAPTIDTTHSLVSLDQVKTSLGLEISNQQILDVVLDGEDEGGQLGGRYFLIANTEREYYVWFDVGNASADPSISYRTGVEVDISAAADAETIASAVATAVTALSGMSSTSIGNTVTMTNAVVGDVTKPNVGNCSTFKMVGTGGRGNRRRIGGRSFS